MLTIMILIRLRMSAARFMLGADPEQTDFDGAFVYVLGEEERKVSLADISTRSMCGNNMALEASVGPLVRRGQRKPLLFQPGKKFIVVCAVIDLGLKSIFRPFYAGRLVQGKTAAVTPGKVTELLRPVRVGGQPGIVHLD